MNREPHSIINFLYNPGVTHHKGIGVSLSVHRCFLIMAVIELKVDVTKFGNLFTSINSVNTQLLITVENIKNKLQKELAFTGRHN